MDAQIQILLCQMDMRLSDMGDKSRNRRILVIRTTNYLSVLCISDLMRLRSIIDHLVTQSNHLICLKPLSYRWNAWDLWVKSDVNQNHWVGVDFHPKFLIEFQIVTWEDMKFLRPLTLYSFHFPILSKALVGSMLWQRNFLLLFIHSFVLFFFSLFFIIICDKKQFLKENNLKERQHNCSYRLWSRSFRNP